MENLSHIDEKIARVSDILEQIEKLNQMIDFHQNISQEESMCKQYQEMKENFLKELGEILQGFKISIDIKAA